MAEQRVRWLVRINPEKSLQKAKNEVMKILVSFPTQLRNCCYMKIFFTPLQSSLCPGSLRIVQL